MCEPVESFLRKEMVEEELAGESVFSTVGLEGGWGKPCLNHLLSHVADTSSFRLGSIRLMEDGCEIFIPMFGAGLKPAILIFQRKSGVNDFDPIGVADNLDGTIDAVGSVHDRVDDGFTESFRG